MSSFGQFTPALRASGTIRPFRFVNASGAYTCDESDANEDSIGVSDGSIADPLAASAVHASDGEFVRLQTGRILWIELGETVADAVLVKSDSDGKAVAVSASGTTEQFEHGQILNGGDSGDIVQMFWRQRLARPEVETTTGA